MPRSEEDHGTNWMIQHHSRALLRLVGLTEVRSCRAAHAVDDHGDHGLHAFGDGGGVVGPVGRKNVVEHSPLYQHWMQEKERETKQAAIVSVLEARFGHVPEEL